MKKTIAIAVGSIFTALAPAAYAQYYARDYDRDSYRNSARVIESRPVYEGSLAARDECWNPRAGHYEEVRGDNKTRIGKGAAIGAIAGGVLGHQVGSGHGNDAATAAGAILGGILGHQLERRNNEDSQDDLDYNNCRRIGADSGRLLGYDVRYEYNGREYMARMDRDPGRRLRLGEEIAYDGTPLNTYSYAAPSDPNYTGGWR
jgi:uncharacterized protein YcfJ